ncbi:MAG TPA: hypothetical protein VIJ25_07460, partial [Methylococcales bacterium]
MSIHDYIPTEELLCDNPVELKRLPKSPIQKFGKYRYDVVLTKSGEKVGDTRMDFREEGPKVLFIPMIRTLYKRRGLGLALYVCASQLADDEGYNPVLGAAEPDYMCAGARHVWASLVLRGLAEGDMSVEDHYRFMPTEL